MSDTIIGKVPITLVSVDTNPTMTLDIILRYTDYTLDKTMRLESGIKYDILYLKDGELHKVVGKIISIGRILKDNNAGYPKQSAEYTIKVDASSDCGSLVVNILVSQIRDIKVFIKYADEDSTIATAENRGGIVTGQINNVVIKDAVIDDNGNGKGGTIDSGTIDPDKGKTNGGTSDGKNPNNNPIVVINPTTIKGGVLTAGTIVQATFPNGYKKDPDTGIVTAEVMTNVVITDAVVKGCTVTGGTVLDPVLKNSIVSGGSRTGSDMITTGATVDGNIATGGVTTGGTVTGGIAIGEIGGVPFTIKDGQTVNGQTTGGVLTGGEVVSGDKIGNITVNAVIKGGSRDGGNTIGGDTKYGTITMNAATISTTTIPVTPTPGPDVNPNMNYDGLIIFDNSSNGVGSNIASVKI